MGARSGTRETLTDYAGHYAQPSYTRFRVSCRNRVHIGVTEIPSGCWRGLKTRQFLGTEATWEAGT